MRAPHSTKGADRRSSEPSPTTRAEGAGLRLALYSHDTMGIGHVRRNLLIAQALAGPPLSATVLLIAGAREAGTFALPPGVDCLTLPSLAKTGDGCYRPRRLRLPLDELIAVRAESIASALRAFRPDVLVVDKEPNGALGELGPALRAARECGTRCVLGLRDVLDDPATVQREWAAAGNEDAVGEFYDAVWVYGDPAVYDAVSEYRFGPAMRAKTTYTGYLNPLARVEGLPTEDGADSDVPDGPFALCTVGGGQDGARVAEAFAAAELPRGLTGVVVTGPFMPRDAQERLCRRAAADPRLRVLEFVPEPCRLLRRASRVVAMGGYNTTCEVLAFGTPALIVPRVSQRREQLIRAERLRDLGLLDVLHPDDAGADALGGWLASEPVAMVHAAARVDLNGIGRLPALVHGLVPSALHPLAAAQSAEVSHAAS